MTRFERVISLFVSLYVSFPVPPEAAWCETDV